MPQVHNRELMRELGGAAGMTKNSRYMASVNYSDATRKRITMINKVEQKVHDLKVQVIDRTVRILKGRRETVIRKYQDSLRAIEAYQRVVMLNMFPRCPRESIEYKLALEKKYTLDALKSKIKLKMVELDPSTIRAKKAKERLDLCRDDYARVLRRNLEHLESESAKLRRPAERRKPEDDEDEDWTSDDDDDADDDEDDDEDIPFGSMGIKVRHSTPIKRDNNDHSPEARLLRRPFLQRAIKPKRPTKHPPRPAKRQHGKQTNRKSSAASPADHDQNSNAHRNISNPGISNSVGRHQRSRAIHEAKAKETSPGQGQHSQHFQINGRLSGDGLAVYNNGPASSSRSHVKRRAEQFHVINRNTASQKYGEKVKSKLEHSLPPIAVVS